MALIEVLNSTVGTVSLEKFQQHINTLQSSDFFGDIELDFCESLSRELMKLPGVRAYPELVALAFWLRKGELLKLKEAQSGIRKSRGLAFHIPPANVDTIFLYSWVTSLLCGNSNVVRISNRAGRATSLILTALSSVFQKGFDSLAQNNLFVRYEHDEAILTTLSQSCDLRVVWGGDSTIRSIRGVAVGPRALDVGFADRFSVALMNAQFLLKKSKSELFEICSNFYNDAYLFNQKACSSPKIIFWVGDGAEILQAKELFFAQLKVVISEKKFFIDESLAMYKLKAAFRGSTDCHIVSSIFESPALVHHDMLGIESVSAARLFDFGGGAFCSINLSDIKELKNVFTKKDQTLSYCGYSPDEMKTFAHELHGLGIDRIVPVGAALKFNTVWDGVDLIHTFSREVYVE